MKFISWNVNGLRAIVKKNFSEVFEALDADFFCLQETKLQEGQIELIYQAIINTGIMRRRKAILARRFSQKNLRYLSVMD